MSILKRPAVIDIGSNSVRLVIYESFATTVNIFYNEKFSCKLGRLTDQGTLSPKSKAKTLQALTRFKKICEANQVTDYRAVATAAIRDATDGTEFADFLSQETGFKIDVISGPQEAIYAAQGVSCKIPTAQGCIGDIGGGSLELAVIHPDNPPQEMVSLPLGTLRLENDIGAPFDQEIYGQHIDQILNNCTFDGTPHAVFYAVGGSWRALLTFYIIVHKIPLNIVQNFTLDADLMVNFIQNILNGHIHIQDYDVHEHIAKRRIQMLPIASLILLKLIEKFKFSKIVISAAGIREGILSDLNEVKYPHNSSALGFAIFEASVRSRNILLAPHFIRLTGQILPNLPENFELLRRIIIFFSDIAHRHHKDFRAQYVFEFILSTHIDDLTHHQRILVAAAVAWRYDPDFQICEKYIIYLNQNMDGLYHSKAIGLALRYLYSITGLSHITAANLDYCKTDTNLEIIKDAALPAGETTQKRFEVLNDHLFK